MERMGRSCEFSGKMRRWVSVEEGWREGIVGENMVGDQANGIPSFERAVRKFEFLADL